MLRKQYAFDHCLKVDALSANGILANDWLNSSGHGGRQTIASNGCAGIISLDGWLAYGTTASWINSATCYTYLPMGLSANATKFTLGMRIRSFTTFAGNYDVVGLTVGGSANMILFTYTELAALRPAGSVSELYVEFVLDTVAKTRELWVNGVLKSTTAWVPNATILAGITSNTLEFYVTNTLWVGPVVTNWFKDIYITDDIVSADDALVGRLGPQRLLPIYVDQATGPWVGDDGATDLKATLNAIPPASAQVVSPTSKEALTLSLNCAVPDGHKVNAISLNLAGKSLGDTVTKTRVELTQGGVTLAPVNITTPRTLAYGQKIASLTLAPDGGPWTAAKIDQTTIVLRPDQ